MTRSALIRRFLAAALQKPAEPVPKAKAPTPAPRVRKAVAEPQEAGRGGVAASVPLAGTFKRPIYQKGQKR